MQLPCIPQNFSSSAQYSHIMQQHCLEDARAELAAGLQDADNNNSTALPVSSIKMLRNPLPDSGGMEEVAVTLTCSFHSTANGSSKLQTHMKPTDVLLLSHTKQQRSGNPKKKRGRRGSKQPVSCSLLAMVTSMPAQKDLAKAMKKAAAAGRETVDVAVTVKLFAEQGSPQYAALVSGNSSGRWLAHVVGSLATSRRAFSAHQQLAEVPLHSSKLLQEVLLHTPPAAAAAAADAGPADSSPHAAAQMHSAVRSYCQQLALDASQEAVLRMTCASAV
jgi:hypothetical protein